MLLSVIKLHGNFLAYLARELTIIGINQGMGSNNGYLPFYAKMHFFLVRAHVYERVIIQLDTKAAEFHKRTRLVQVEGSIS